MASRPYAPPRRTRAAATNDRVLEAAADLAAEDRFHTATMEELAQRAGVSRATVFTRFQSKLGVLEALSRRCSGGPELQAIRDAVELDDPVEALAAFVAASCAFWDLQGFILAQLKAIVVLEPEASTLIDEQRREQREVVERLVRRLERSGHLRPGVTRQRAVATIHLLTSLESYRELRRGAGMSRRQSAQNLTELARSLLR
jgi:AcrR family transcriptional regulator